MSLDEYLSRLEEEYGDIASVEHDGDTISIDRTHRDGFPRAFSRRLLHHGYVFAFQGGTKYVFEAADSLAGTGEPAGDIFDA